MLWNLFAYLSCSILIVCIVCTPNWMKKLLNCCTTSFFSLPEKTQNQNPNKNKQKKPTSKYLCIHKLEFPPLPQHWLVQSLQTTFAIKTEHHVLQNFKTWQWLHEYISQNLELWEVFSLYDFPDTLCCFITRRLYFWDVSITD